MNNFKKIVRFLINNVFYNVRIYNSEVLSSDKKIIICPNHTSNLDGIIFWANTDNTKIMAKSQLFKYRFLANALRKIGVFPINRDIADVKHIKEAIDILDGNCNIVMFPQGTRKKGRIEDTIHNLKGGASFLGNKTSSYLLPTYITDDYSVFKNRSIDIIYGDLYCPISKVITKSNRNIDMKCVSDEIIRCKQLIKIKKKEKKKNVLVKNPQIN